MTIKYKQSRVGGDRGEIRSDQILLIDTDDPDATKYIPCVPDNRDYKEYLAWVDEGNTAEPADAEKE